MNDSAEQVRRVLNLLVRAALVSDDAESFAYRQQAEDARRRLLGLLAGGHPAERVNVDGAWVLAVQDAESPEMLPREGRVALGLPVACPIALDELLAPGFDADRGVRRIREAAATG